MRIGRGNLLQSASVGLSRPLSCREDKISTVRNQLALSLAGSPIKYVCNDGQIALFIPHASNRTIWNIGDGNFENH